VRALLALLLWFVQDPTGVIEGAVVRAGTNPLLPLVGARVELTGGPQTLVARTNGAGKFSFGGLPAGTYQLVATRDGYIRQPYGSLSDPGPGLSLRIAAGERVDTVLFELQPAPTISGRIDGASNKPLADVVVQALKMIYDAVGARHLTVFASTRTDDRGQYRLYWLDPGEYFIQALAPPPGEGVKTRVAYAPTFFPGFPSIDNARTVRSDAGRETGGVDFTMTQQAIASVTGRVIHALTHDPVAARVRLTPVTSPEFHLYEAACDPDGSFLFSGVAPGNYVVTAVSATGEPLVAARQVQVRDFDPRIILEVGPGIGLEGQIFFAQAPVDVKEMLVSLLPLEPFLQPVSGLVDAAGRLLWNGIHPGKYVIDVSGLPQDLYLADARFGADDPMNKPLEVGYSETAFPPLQLLLAADGGNLTGRVFDGSDRLLAGAVITLVPFENPVHQVYKYRVTASDANGSFFLRGIPPGDYDLYAWQAIEPRAWLNMDFLRLYEHLSLRVQIRSGENAPVAIPAIEP
jgi:protocatechuate 3,4-dioxygenase beta subunit